MDIAQIRKDNMLALVGDFRTQAEFAKKIDKPPSYISQIKKGMDKHGKRITMGHDVARDIEKALNLPFGWMDRQHNAISIQNQFNNNGYVGGSVNQSTANHYSINHDADSLLEIGFYPNANFNENQQSLYVTKQLFSANARQMVATVMSDDFMQPIIKEKVVVIADTSQATGLIYSGKIYLLNMGGLLICRYLQQLSGNRMKVFSQRDELGDTLDMADFERDYHIVGRVVWQAGFVE